MHSDADLFPAQPGMSGDGATHAAAAGGALPGGVSISLDADADAPTRARRAAADALDGWPSDRRDAVLLVISELVTNAVRYGSCDRRDRVSLAIRRRGGATTRVEVVDSRARGGVVEEAARRGGAQRSGWGLPIVAELTDRWGVERGPGRTCVWCEIDDL